MRGAGDVSRLTLNDYTPETNRHDERETPTREDVGPVERSYYVPGVGGIGRRSHWARRCLTRAATRSGVRIGMTRIGTCSSTCSSTNRSITRSSTSSGSSRSTVAVMRVAGSSSMPGPMTNDTGGGKRVDRGLEAGVVTAIGAVVVAAIDVLAFGSGETFHCLC